MIRILRNKRATKPFINTHTPQYQLICHKKVSEIKQQYSGQGILGQIRTVSKIAGLVFSSAWKDFKADRVLYKKIKSVPID